MKKGRETVQEQGLQNTVEFCKDGGELSIFSLFFLFFGRKQLKRLFWGKKTEHVGH